MPRLKTFVPAALVLAVATLVAACGPPPNQFDFVRIANQPYVVNEAQSEMVGGKLYSFGGFDSTKTCCVPTDRAYVYDPGANGWTRIAAMPTGGATHAGMATDGTDIFYAGGYIKNAAGTGQVFGTKAAWRYDVSENRYYFLPNLPDFRAGGQLEHLNGKLHYFGGTNIQRTADVGTHYVLDLSGGGWTTAAPLPNPRHHMGSAVLGNLIYAVGGQHRHDGALTTQTSVHAYNPGSNSWAEKAPLPQGRGHISNTTFALSGRIIVAGGEQAHASSRNSVFAYSPGGDWLAITSLPAYRASSVGGPLGSGYLISGGGNSNLGWRASPRQS